MKITRLIDPESTATVCIEVPQDYYDRPAVLRLTDYKGGQATITLTTDELQELINDFNTVKLAMIASAKTRG